MTERAPDRRFGIVYEDRWLIAVDKPSGLLVIETPKRERHTLTRLVDEYLDSEGIEANAHPCHRIDRETSGLVLYAKGKAAQKLMMDEFKFRRVKKRYTAFVHGAPGRPCDTITSHLYNKKTGKKELAITRYRVSAARGAYSVVEVEPVTGRTNQIRRHFRDIGHPLVGERVFAFAKDFGLKFRRVALHAESLEFTHPVTKERIALAAELPADMREFLKR